MNTYNPPYTFPAMDYRPKIQNGVLPFKTTESGPKYMILPFDEQVYELMKEKYKEETV